MPTRIFISYSHKDAEFRRKLEVHLAALKREGVETFYDGDIHPGGELDGVIRRELRAANVFVALASPEYLHSEYCFVKEYAYALGRAKRKTMHVVVAVVRPCQWKHTRMARYKALPEDGKEVTKWGSRDSAFEDIVNGVRRIVELAEASEVLGKERRRVRYPAPAGKPKATGPALKVTKSRRATKAKTARGTASPVSAVSKKMTPRKPSGTTTVKTPKTPMPGSKPRSRS